MENRVEELENQIKLKRDELRELRSELASAKVDAFCKSKGMRKNQRFLYNGKECSSLFLNIDDWFFSAKKVKKDGTVSSMNVTIYDRDNIEPINKFD